MAQAIGAQLKKGWRAVGPETLANASFPFMSKKTKPFENLTAKIRRSPAWPKRTLNGNLLVPPSDPSEGLLTEEDWVHMAMALNLTTRELEVAILLFEGETRAGIARRLGRAPGTVRVYIDRLFKKLRVNDLRGLILRVVRAHLASRAKPD